jgi:hypothetical protein
MKLIVFLVIFFSAGNSLFSQSTVERLKIFYKTSDFECYIEKTKQNIITAHNAKCEWWGMDSSTIQPPKIDLTLENAVPILNISFINTENYKYTDNIYDYIVIDSVRVFSFAHIDKSFNLKHITYYEFGDLYADLHKLNPKLKHIIRKINKEKPDLIMCCVSLRNWIPNLDRDDNCFLFVKQNSIYLYHIDNNKKYELNYYVRNFYSLDKIQNLNKTEILSIFTDKGYSTRITGKTPKNEIQMCPAIAYFQSEY